MAQKKGDGRAALQALKGQLSSGQIGQLYLFHGEEVYLRDFYLGRLREQLVGGGMEEFNLHTLKAGEVTPRALEEAVDCLPMMSQRTLVLLVDFDPFKAGEKDREAYAKLLGSLPDYCCVVLVYDLIPYKADARTKLAAVFRDKGLVVNFARQEQGDLVDWIRRRFRALGRDIDSELARYPHLPVRRPDDRPDRGDREDRRLRQGQPGHPPGHRRGGHPPVGRGGLSDDRRHRRRQGGPGCPGAGGPVPHAGAPPSASWPPWAGTSGSSTPPG